MAADQSGHGEDWAVLWKLYEALRSIHGVTSDNAAFQRVYTEKGIATCWQAGADALKLLWPKEKPAIQNLCDQVIRNPSDGPIKLGRYHGATAVALIAELAPRFLRCVEWAELPEGDCSELPDLEDLPEGTPPDPPAVLNCLRDRATQEFSECSHNWWQVFRVQLEREQGRAFSIEKHDAPTPSGDGTEGSDSFRGYLGGVELREALGIDSTQTGAFERQLGRKRNAGSLGDKDWKEDSDRRKGEPLYLFADTEALRVLAERYKSPKACRSSV